MPKLTPQQKLQIIRDIDNAVSVGLTRALSFFEQKIAELGDEKKKEFEKVLADMNGEIKRLQLKDGYTPRKFVDYFTPDEIAQIIKASTPQKGKDFLTETEMGAVQKTIAERVMTMITVKDGLTPKAGIDYPTFSQVEDMVTKIFMDQESSEDIKNNGEKTLETIKEQFTAVEITGEEIIKKINSAPAHFQIPASRISGLPRDKKGTDKKYKHGGGGGGGLAFYYDLSSLTDGSTKTFTIPKNSKIIWVAGSDAPAGQYRQTTDYTGTGTTTLTLTSAVAAPSLGATLHILYIEG